MRRSAVMSAIVLAVAAFGATPGSAQINARSLTLAGLSECLTEALANNAADDAGDAVIYSCTAAKARTLYNFLGKKVRAEVVQDRNGKFENRAFGNCACYHRVEDQGGNAADEFRCDLVIAIGDVLGE